MQALGVAKARLDHTTTFVLAVLAGAFTSLGAIFFTVAVTDPPDSYGLTRLIGRLSFSLGLVLVVVAGAEPFTGNNLAAMAWASKLIATRELARVGSSSTSATLSVRLGRSALFGQPISML